MSPAAQASVPPGFTGVLSSAWSSILYSAFDSRVYKKIKVWKASPRRVNRRFKTVRTPSKPAGILTAIVATVVAFNETLTGSVHLPVLSVGHCTETRNRVMNWFKLSHYVFKPNVSLLVSVEKNVQASFDCPYVNLMAFASVLSIIPPMITCLLSKWQADGY